MEFSHVGGHCEMEGCNQQDFLPFKCSLCSKNLCLLHRSLVAHSCVSGGAMDIISLECPICNKSIKMNRTDDPNIEWNRHFTTTCDHQPSTAQPVNKCAAKNCTTILGPSNQIKCNTCHRQVCLAHRSADAHNCKELKRADMLQHQMKTNSNLFTSNSQSQSTSSKTTGSSKTNKTPQTKKSNQVDSSNSLQGTAHRRQQQQQQQQQQTQQQSTSSSSSSSQTNSDVIEPCPICGKIFQSLQLLTSHLDQEHLNSNNSNLGLTASPAPAPASAPFRGTTSNPPPAPPVATNVNGREVCPQCSLRFDNIVDLIQHVERDHSNTSSSRDNNCDLS